MKNPNFLQIGMRLPGIKELVLWHLGRIVTGNVNECKSLWIYLVGPSLGGVLAAYVYGNFFKTFFYHKNKVMTHSI